jgi:hypothetical protein
MSSLIPPLADQDSATRVDASTADRASAAAVVSATDLAAPAIGPESTQPSPVAHGAAQS